VSGALAVASREIRERRQVVIVSIAAGLLPLAWSLLPLGRRGGGVDADGLAALLVIALPAAVAVALGASVLGRDIAERRLGFYFARPLSGLAIWAGKMGAAVALTLASVAFVAGPSLLVGRLTMLQLFPRLSLILALLALVMLIAVVHAAACSWRSRSGLLPWDLAALVLFGGVIAFLAHALLVHGARDTALYVALPSLLVGLVIGTTAAGAAQVVLGRTDTRRGHLALSATLWGAAGVSAVALALFTQWVLAAQPGNVTESPIRSAFRRPWPIKRASTGDWFVLGPIGHRAGYAPSFLVNAATGRALALGSEEVLSSILFSADGRRAVWLERPFQTAVLVNAQLGGSEPVLARVAVGSGRLNPLALNDDGTRLLASSATSAVLLNTVTGERVNEVAGTRIFAAELRPGSGVRLYRRPLSGSRTQSATNVFASVVSTEDWDTSTGELVERSRIAADTPATSLYPRDVRGDRMIVEERAWTGTTGATLALYDTSTGRRDVRLCDHADSVLGRWLDDGRIAAVCQVKGTTARLALFDAAGRPGPTLELPDSAGWFASWGGQAGQVAVIGLHKWLDAKDIRRDQPSGKFRTVFVDLAAARVLREEGDIAPAWSWPWWQGGSDHPSPRLLVGAAGGIFDVDPATGTRRTIVPPRS
jgi:hypothetical protein